MTEEAGKKAGRTVVIGGASVDLKGRPYGKLTPHTSNRGVLEKSTGGVAFNIAQNLARLGLDVDFITITGRDREGDYIRDECKKAGISTDFCACIEKSATAVYQAILDEHGELALAITAMDIFDFLTPEMLMPCHNLLLQSSMVIADTNLPAPTLHHLSHFCGSRGIPLFVEPTAADKCCRILPHLQGITCLSPNREELEALCGRVLRSPEEVSSAAEKLVEKGIGRVCVTLGRDGVCSAGPGGVVFRKSREIEVKDVTGAGDAFVSGMIWALLRGCSAEDALDYGIAASLITIQVYQSVCPDLSPELLESKRKEYLKNV